MIESQISRPPRSRRISIGALVPAAAAASAARADAVGVAELAAQELAELAAEHPSRPQARDALGGRVPARDAVVGVGGHDRVGDLGEDRLARVLLLRHALVQERVSQRDRRRAGQRGQAVDLVGAEAARACARRRRARPGSRRPPSARARRGRRRVPRRGRSARRPRAGRPRGRRSRPAPDPRASRRRSGRCASERRTESSSEASPSTARGDQLAALEQAQRARVGREQVGGLGHDLAQHRARLEVGGEQGRDALQLARERARAVLGLLERGALERSDRRLLQALGEGEIGVAEGARRVPGDGHDARPLAGPIARERHAQKRPRAEPLVLGRIEAGIRRGAACGDHAALVGRETLERRHPAACAMARDDGQALAVPHLGSIGLERGGRRACDRLERILDGVGRRELGGDERGDAVEPAPAGRARRTPRRSRARATRAARARSRARSRRARRRRRR